MTLREGLLWLMGIGAGVLAFYAIDRLENQNKWPIIAAWLAMLRPDDKRGLAFVATAGIAVVAYLGTLLMLYEITPTSWRVWVEELFKVSAAAIVASQVVHGRVVLRRRAPD